MRWDGSKLPAKERVFSPALRSGLRVSRLFHPRRFLPSRTRARRGDRAPAADMRSKLAVFVDDGVVREMPDLARRIAGYARSPSARVELAGAVIVVKGGEGARTIRRWSRACSAGSSSSASIVIPTSSPSAAARCSTSSAMSPPRRIAAFAISASRPRCSRRTIRASA